MSTKPMPDKPDPQVANFESFIHALFCLKTTKHYQMHGNSALRSLGV